MVEINITEIYADRSNLAALLILDARIEPFPESFRLQPQLRIIIPQAEYKAFSGEQSIQSYFNAVSRAVAKELYYAYSFYGKPTEIRADAAIRTYKPFELTAAENALRQAMKLAGYFLPSALDADWEYAFRLCAEAMFSSA